MRQALRMVLDADPALSVVAQAGEITRTVALVHTHHPDVLVLDLRMRNDSTLSTVRRLRSEAPGTQVVIITMGDGRAFAARSHEAGAVGFVMKDRADADLVEAVRRAARGEEFTSPSVSPGLEFMTPSVLPGR